MRRFHLALLAGLPAFVLALTLTGCGGGGGHPDDDLKPRERGGTRAAAKPKQALVAETGDYSGTITGKVTWEGDTDFDALTESLLTTVKVNSNAKECLSPKAKDYEKNQQQFRVGTNKQLGNVFVWIEPVKGKYFQVSDDQLKKLPKEVRISQPHCAFLPHCSLHVPVVYKDGDHVSTKQQLVIDNYSTMGHNANVSGVGNRTIPPGKEDTFKLTPSRNEVTLSCNVHGWMRAYVRVMDHPYGAITSVGRKGNVHEDMNDATVGTYRIEGVPIGAKVRLFAWHEAATLDRGKGEEITLGKENNFEFVATRKK